MHRFRRLRAHFIRTIFLVGLISPSFGQDTGPRCYGDGCEPSSRRSADWCWVSFRDGPRFYENPIIPALWQTWHTSSFPFTTPDGRFLISGGDFKLLDTTYTQSGGNWAGVNTSYTEVVYDRVLGTTSTRSTGAGWATCGCNDSINPNYALWGVDLHCYCPRGFVWDSSRRTCTRAFDIVRDGGSCPADGNPIHALTGHKEQSIAVPLGGGLGSLNITYDTRLLIPSTDGTPKFSPRVAHSLGGAWSTQVHRKLFLQNDFTGQPLAVHAGRGGGRWVTFSRRPNGSYAPLPGVADRLDRTAAGWRLVDMQNATVDNYDAQGNLVQSQRADGPAINYTYSDGATPEAVAPRAGLLIAMQDSFGNRAQFNYVQPVEPTIYPRLTRIVDAAGAATTIAYQERSPASITWPDGTSRQFLYEDARWPWALTGIVDELGARSGTYTYDGDGRATSTERAGGVSRYAATWTAPPAWSIATTLDPATGMLRREHTMVRPEGVDVTQPNGTVVSYGATLVDGMPRLESRSQPAGAGCAASVSNRSYDAQGNVTSEDDFNGTRMCASHDVLRSLEVVRVEGLPGGTSCSAIAGGSIPAGSRKTSTQWHPDWRLQVARAQAGRLTFWVYNGQPDPMNGNAPAGCAPAGAVLPDGRPIAVLCHQVELATTDADGAQGFSASLDATVAPRAQSWTYNAHGQVLSHKGARNDVNDVTTYSYYADADADHRVGDLRSISNALGHTTWFTRHNRLGQPLESVDANGVVTIRSYDLRHRPVRVDVGGRITTYAYDAAGQLVRVTHPDGSFAAYAYDAAHRLIEAADDLGNRLVYTLDSAGNRVVERMFDPGGTLRRQLQRSFDALGRVQQTIGE